MKTRIQFTRYTLIALLIALFLVSVYMAIIISQYMIVVNGILGLVVLYLLFFYIRFSKIDVTIDTLLSDPKKIKYFVFALIGPLISYLAVMQIFETALFFWK